MKRKVRKGDLIPVWWTTKRGDNMAEVLDILPYTGMYHFSCVLRLDCPGTRKGYTEMAYEDNYYTPTKEIQ
jgi:hypothetical protein